METNKQKNQPIGYCTETEGNEKWPSCIVVTVLALDSYHDTPTSNVDSLVVM